MNPQSVRDLKAEISANVVANDFLPGARSFYESTLPPMPNGVALGIGKAPNGEHVLAVRTNDPRKADEMSGKAHGEADVKILTVTKRHTPAHLQSRQRPIEAGLQIAMKDKSFVGTLGFFARDADLRLYAVTNAHVAANEGFASPGHRIGQPFGNRIEDYVGVLDRFVPLSLSAPNVVDAAAVRVDKTTALPTHNSAVHRDVVGTKVATLGMRVLKIGRTTGVQLGTVTAVEVDGLGVGYDMGTIVFNDQVEFSGGPTSDFSAPGDSGSLIVSEDGEAVALLFAGGRSASGEDFTFGNPIDVVLERLALQLA